MAGEVEAEGAICVDGGAGASNEVIGEIPLAMTRNGNTGHPRVTAAAAAAAVDVAAAVKAATALGLGLRVAAGERGGAGSVLVECIGAGPGAKAGESRETPA